MNRQNPEALPGEHLRAFRDRKGVMRRIGISAASAWGYLLILLLVLGQGFYMNLQLQRALESLHEHEQKVLESRVLLEEIRTIPLQIRLQVQRSALEMSEQHFLTATRKSAQFFRMLKQLRQLLGDCQCTQAVFDRLDILEDDFRDYQRLALEQVDEVMGLPQHRALPLKREREAAATFFVELDDFIEWFFPLQQDRMKQRITQMEERQRNLSYGAMALLILMVAIFSWGVRRKIVMPVQRLGEGAVQLMEGNMEARVAPVGLRELYQLGNSFNHAVESLQQHTISVQFLQLIFSALTEPLLVIEPKGRIQQANQAAEQLLGVEQEGGLIGQSIKQLLPHVEFCHLLQPESLKQGVDALQQQAVVDLDGMNEMLLEAPVGILRMNETGEILFANPCLGDTLGYSTEALERGGLSELLLAEDMEIAQRVIARTLLDMQQETSVEVSLLRGVHVDGSLVELEATFFPIQVQGKLQLVALLLDRQCGLPWEIAQYTPFGELFGGGSDEEVHGNGDEVIRFHRRSRTVLSASNEEIPVYLSGSVLMASNQRLESIVLVLRDRRSEIHAEQREQFLAYQSGMAEMNSAVLHNIGNSLFSLGGSGEKLERKVTDLIRIIGYLKQQSEPRLEALGGSATAEQGELIVELGKLLEAGLESLQQLCAEEREEVDRLHTTTDHIRGIIEARKEGEAFGGEVSSEFSLHKLFEDAVQMFQEDLQQQRITAEIHTGERSQMRHMRNPLLQAVVNLLKNSIDAIVERRQRGDGKGGAIHLNADEVEGKWVISVSDDGIGVDSVARQQLFNFGFTTKQSGSGVGLHSVATFVQSQGGEIEMASEGENCGAVVTLRLKIY